MHHLTTYKEQKCATDLWLCIFKIAELFKHWKSDKETLDSPMKKAFRFYMIVYG